MAVPAFAMTYSMWSYINELANSGPYTPTEHTYAYIQHTFAAVYLLLCLKVEGLLYVCHKSIYVLHNTVKWAILVFKKDLLYYQ